jgi:hypothetical protein
LSESDTNHYIIVRKLLDWIFKIRLYNLKVYTRDLVEHRGIFFRKVAHSRYDVDSEIFQTKYKHALKHHNTSTYSKYLYA